MDIFLVNNMVEVQWMIGFDHIHIKFNTTVFRLVMQIFVRFTGHYKKQSITINRAILITEDFLGNPVKMLFSGDRCGLMTGAVWGHFFLKDVCLALRSIYCFFNILLFLLFKFKTFSLSSFGCHTFPMKMVEYVCDILYSVLTVDIFTNTQSWQ